MESPFQTIGPLQEAQARARSYDDWERTVGRLREPREIDDIKRWMKTAITRIVRALRPPVTHEPIYA